MMEFLKKCEFTDDEINFLSQSIPNLIQEIIGKQEKLVIANIMYLKDLGVENYKEVFKKFYEVFLLDHTEFIGVFDKYEKEDLIKYLKNNVNILEFL